MPSPDDTWIPPPHNRPLHRGKKVSSVGPTDFCRTPANLPRCPPRLPPRVRQFLSPTLSSGAVIILLTAGYGAVSLGSWKAGVQLYKRGTGGGWGGLGVGELTLQGLGLTFLFRGGGGGEQVLFWVCSLVQLSPL